MGDYSFLANLNITDPGRVRPPKNNNPEGGLFLRVMAHGNVFPSKELVAKFNLEFKNAQRAYDKIHESIYNSDLANVQETNQGNGLDIVDTKDWKPLQGHPRILMFGITPKSESKVDLFATTRHYEDGTPKASVMSRGEANMFLLSLVKEFGWLTGEQKYVDLKIVAEHPFTTTDGIAYIPKVIEKGNRKGEQDYKRRDNITFYPVEMVETDEKAIEENKTTIVSIQ